MRPTFLFAAVILAAASPAAFAQAATPASAAPAPALPPPPEPPTDTTPSTSAAELQAFNTRIEADDATLTRLRDVELARGNAVIRGVKPALAFSNHWYAMKLPTEGSDTQWAAPQIHLHLPKL